MRVLIISHGHPTYSIGGAEVASHTLFRALNEIVGVDAHYLARAPQALRRHPNTPMMSLRHCENETFYHTGAWDEFWLSNDGLDDLSGPFTEHLQRLEPDVVHFHHMIGFGVEAIAAVRRALPQSRIVVTFHEYLSICANHGQMIKNGKRQLCHGADPASCSLCFPGHAPAEFFAREEHLRRHLLLADGFISPSDFLRRRYEAWGLPSDRFFTIENGVTGAAEPVRTIAEGGRRNRFGYFGQITEFKGLHIVLDAISRVPDDVWGDATLSVFGGNLEFQPQAFRNRFEQLLEQAGRRARFFGSYRHDELPGLMADVDWVVMPSIWWENSPVVIQEAFLHRRPPIVSGIGGMAEKVRHEHDGLHFRAGSPESLADRLIRAINQPELWQRLSEAAPAPADPQRAAALHLDAYAALARLPQPGRASDALRSAA